MMTKKGLIYHIIEDMGLGVEHCDPKSTPYMKDPLTKYLGNYPCSESSPIQISLGCCNIWMDILILTFLTL